MSYNGDWRSDVDKFFLKEGELLSNMFEKVREDIKIERAPMEEFWPKDRFFTPDRWPYNSKVWEEALMSSGGDYMIHGFPKSRGYKLYEPLRNVWFIYKTDEEELKKELEEAEKTVQEFKAKLDKALKEAQVLEEFSRRVQ